MTELSRLSREVEAAHLADLLLYHRPDNCPRKIEARRLLNEAKAIFDAVAMNMRKAVAPKAGTTRCYSCGKALCSCSDAQWNAPTSVAGAQAWAMRAGVA